VTQFGQCEGMANNPVVGCVGSVLTFTGDTDTVLAASHNGGIWRATNFSAGGAGPTWTNTTSTLGSLSIGAMAYNRLDENTVYAGFSNWSNYASVGGPLNGLIVSNNAGQTWAPVAAPNLNNTNVRGLVARGNGVVVVASDTVQRINGANSVPGLFRPSSTTNPDPGGGPTGTMINIAGNGTSGLPAGDYTDVCNAPGNLSAMYCGVVNSTANGVYRSTDAGQTWSRVFTAPANTVNIRLAGRDNAFGPAQTCFAAFVTNGGGSAVLSSIRRTANDGTSWEQVYAGQNFSDNFGWHNPAAGQGQGIKNTSIVADPTDPNVVYVGGQSQDDTGAAPPFPNQLGAIDYSGRLYRGTYNPTSGATAWDSLTNRGQTAAMEPGRTPNGGTASNSSPHADSRSMAFIPRTGGGFNLIEGDDGGIYQRTSPQNNTGDWQSRIGTGLQISESNFVAIDPLNGRLMAGSQDTGITQQTAAGSKIWEQAPADPTAGFPQNRVSADGGRVQTGLTTNGGGARSIRYCSIQGMTGFQYALYKADGTPDGNPVSIAMAKDTGGNFSRGTDGGTPMTTWALNRWDSSLLVVGGTGTAFRSVDRGQNLITNGGIRAGSVISAMAYGGMQNGQQELGITFAGSGGTFALAGGNADMYRRQTGSETYERLTGYGGAGVEDINMNARNWANLFVADGAGIWQSTNADAAAGTVAFAAMTNNGLPASFFPQCLESEAEGLRTKIFVGGFGGVYYRFDDAAAGANWTLLAGIPNVFVRDLSYDVNTGILAAATLGRGIWTIYIPEPAALSLLGMAGLLALRRRRA